MDPLEEQQNKNKIDAELKAAVNKELSAFMNPQTGETLPINPISPETLKNPIDPSEKIPSSIVSESALNTLQPQPQNRPIIRTYKSDVEERMQAGHISSINIAVAENEKMRSGMRTGILADEKKSKINKNVLIISLVLLIGGVLAIFIPLFLVQKQNAPAPVPVETVPSGAIITTELEEKINIKDIDLSNFNTIMQQRVDQSATSLGQIKNIYLTKGTGTSETLISASEFLSFMKAHVTDEMANTLRMQYMFGMHNYNGNQRFLILKIGAYDTAFSGMLKWEQNLWQDFKEIFELKDVDATSTPNFGIEIKTFQDATYDNKDARIVKDNLGNIIFLYSIIDDNTVVITTSVDTLRELIDRVGRSRAVTQ